MTVLTEVNDLKPSTRAYINKATRSYNRQDAEEMVLGQQSKQKRNKIKIEIFTAVFRFPNHTMKLKASDQPQSAREERYLTYDITQLLMQRFV